MIEEICETIEIEDDDSVSTGENKRQPTQNFMLPKKPDAALSAITGSKELPITEATKKIWAHIKKNDLQDKYKQNMINTDKKLKAICNGKNQVSMFELPKYVNNHLCE